MLAKQRRSGANTSVKAPQEENEQATLASIRPANPKRSFARTYQISEAFQRHGLQLDDNCNSFANSKRHQSDNINTSSGSSSGYLSALAVANKTIESNESANIYAASNEQLGRSLRAPPPPPPSASSRAAALAAFQQQQQQQQQHWRVRSIGSLRAQSMVPMMIDDDERCQLDEAHLIDDDIGVRLDHEAASLDYGDAFNALQLYRQQEARECADSVKIQPGRHQQRHHRACLETDSAGRRPQLLAANAHQATQANGNHREASYQKYPLPFNATSASSSASSQASQANLQHHHQQQQPQAPLYHQPKLSQYQQLYNHHHQLPPINSFSYLHQQQASQAQLSSANFRQQHLYAEEPEETLFSAPNLSEQNNATSRLGGFDELAFQRQLAEVSSKADSQKQRTKKKKKKKYNYNNSNNNKMQAGSRQQLTASATSDSLHNQHHHSKRTAKSPTGRKTPNSNSSAHLNIPRHGSSNKTSLNCCGKLAKLLLFITNISFWSAGIALGAWGILQLVDDHKYNLSQLLVFEPNSRMSLFQLLSWSFITLGCATILVGFCGCSAIFKNNRWILGLYIFLILAIFALDLATGLLAIIFQEKLVANVRLRLGNKLRSEYGVQASFTAAIDYIQTKFECCGLEGHFDYDQSLWRLQRLGGFEATVARTCCHLRNTYDDQAHINPRPVNESMCQSTDVRFHQSYRYRKGCLDDLERLVRQKIWFFTIGCGAVGCVILLSLLFATCFCRSISGSVKKNSANSIREQQQTAVAILNHSQKQHTGSTQQILPQEVKRHYR